MCGIAGLWKPGSASRGEAVAMADRLSHRGPDSSGAWIDAEVGIALSHRRLSIIDLSAAGHQPMASPCGRYMLTFNGEIYNHLDIRGELEATAPVEWRGHSDTETLVHAVARWGLAGALRRSVGMFALGLWDRQERTLSLARDRLGEKPLFYGWTTGGVVFGSELKALRGSNNFANPVDPDVLALYFRYNYVPAPWSILRHVFKVEPGAIVTIDRAALGAPPSQAPTARAPDATTGVRITRYWSLDAVVAAGADDGLTAETAVAQLEERLVDAIRLQTVADVPVGAFLSGGVDSSAIVALMRNVTHAHVKTFTIGFGESGYDEAPYAREVARHLGTDHTELYVGADDVRGVIPELPTIYDEPFADSSQLPTVLLSRLTRQSVTVALSGDAGDELFGGYNRYLVSRRVWDVAAAVPAPLRSGIGRAITAVSPGSWDRIGGLPFTPKLPMLGVKAHKIGRMLQGSVSTLDIYQSASEEWHGSPPARSADRLRSPVDQAPVERETAEEQMMHWDMTSYLPNDILTKVDRAAMAASLETRVPFLDHRVVEQAWRTPLRFKIRDGQGKWVLRQLLYKYVPKAMIERPKAGFAIPIGAWLRGPLREWAEDLLSPPALAETPALDARLILERWRQHQAGTHDWTGGLWGVLMFQAWQRRWSQEAPRLAA
ncbi:MAG: asparagine synthase (glutamine-hydrolyzing) [Janthinobacterium lividum]